MIECARVLALPLVERTLRKHKLYYMDLTSWKDDERVKDTVFRRAKYCKQEFKTGFRLEERENKTHRDFIGSILQSVHHMNKTLGTHSYPGQHFFT